MTPEKAVSNTGTTKVFKKRREKTAISVAVGKNIAIRRKLAGMTQQRLAEALGIEKETVSRLENGEIAQTVDRLDALGKILHCAVTDFFNEEKMGANQYAAAIGSLIAPLPAERQRATAQAIPDEGGDLFEKFAMESSRFGTGAVAQRGGSGRRF